MGFKKVKAWRIIPSLILLILSVSAFGADPVITSEKAAEINGVSISMKNLENEYNQVLKQKGISDENKTEEQVVADKKELLDALINQELLFQESMNKEIVIGETEVASSLNTVKSKFESEEAFHSALKSANMKEEDLKSRIRRTLSINALVDELIGRHLVVTDEETMAYYDAHPDSFIEEEQVRASHILVKVDKDAGEAKKVTAKEKISTIQRRIKDGEDFAQLATELSDCPSSANGGDLGYFKKGVMVQEFEEVAFGLSPGSVSDIVQTAFGYHLIKVADKKEGGTISYETVKSDLQNFIKQQKMSKEVGSLIEKLREDAKIETYL